MKLKATSRLRQALAEPDRLKVKARSGEETVKATVTLEGSPDCVERVLALLSVIHLNGSWGHSGIFGVSWDGDGRDFVDLTGDVDPSKYKDLAQAMGDHVGAVEYIGEGATGFVLNNDSSSSYPKHTRVFPAQEDKS